MGIKNVLKFRLRRGLGILELGESLKQQTEPIQASLERIEESLKTDENILSSQGNLLEEKDKRQQEKNAQIRAILELLLKEYQEKHKAYEAQIQSMLALFFKENDEVQNQKFRAIIEFISKNNEVDDQIYLNKIRAILDLLLADTQAKSEEYNHQFELLLQEKEKKLIQEIVNNSKPGSVFSCCINGIELLAPVEQLRMYPHCLHFSAEQKLNYLVETQQSDWLSSKVESGDVVLDVGAAFGIITVALSQAVGSQGCIHAFEPSRNTRKFLQQILELNDIQNVTIVPFAISDRPGTAEFIEYTSDNELTWASDASTLAAETINPVMKYLRYQVELTTIDDYVAATGIKPKALKIDIEGFELYALQGGKTTLEKFSPYLCIDIHTDVKTGKSAILGVEPYLLGLGYELQMEGHALYCTPEKLT